MLEYDRIDVSEGIDVDETNALKECEICHFGILKIKREYGRNRHKNMFEEKKQRFEKYQKTYRKANKSRKS